VFLRKAGPYQSLIERQSYKNILANADYKSYVEMIEQRPIYAQGLLTELLQAPPDNLNDFDQMLISFCYFRLGDAARAAEVIAPYRANSVFNLYLYGKILLALGRFQEAVATFREGLTRYGAPEFQQALDDASRAEGK
jgi:tetratricopeptide (TPR) repeat protein